MATIFEANPTMGSFMLPGMPSPAPSDASMGRVVRFDNECVLIPHATQRTKHPLVLTKSYSLPLWKKKGNQLSDSDVEDAVAGTSNVRSPSPEESRARVVIKVPIPLFSRRSRSPTPRGRSVSTSPTIPKALSPCLVHRSPSTPAGSTPSSPVRRPMQPGYHRHKDELTVPLRPCCEACEHITDQSLKEGDHWQEKFSRGARRRRSPSLENNDLRGESYFSHTRIRNEFFALSKSLDAIGSSQHGSPSTFSLTVDEVDKRRKSRDFSEEPSSSSSPSHLFHSPGSPYSGSARYPRYKPHERDVSSSSTHSSTSTTPDEIVPEGIDPRGRHRSSPIEEEDEAELFPLPSPRRSPSGTPSPSPSPKISPAPSPNGSTSCLPAGLIAPGATSARKSSSTQENISPSKTNSSQESLLKASLSRKQAGSYLAAPAKSTLPLQSSNTGRLPPNSSSLATSPIAATASTSPTTTEVISERGIGVRTAPRSKEKYLSPILTSSPSSEPANVSPTSQTAAASTRLTPVSIKPVVGFPTSAAIPTPSSPKAPTHGRHVQGHVQTGHQHLGPHSSATSSSSETPISPPGPQKRKHSFTLPFIKAGEVIRDASVDVLKGVSSISGGGGLVGSV